jgi:hypothetical protein
MMEGSAHSPPLVPMQRDQISSRSTAYRHRTRSNHVSGVSARTGNRMRLHGVAQVFLDQDGARLKSAPSVAHEWSDVAHTKGFTCSPAAELGDISSAGEYSLIVHTRFVSQLCRFSDRVKQRILGPRLNRRDLVASG